MLQWSRQMVQVCNENDYATTQPVFLVKFKLLSQLISHYANCGKSSAVLCQGDYSCSYNSHCVIHFGLHV